MFPSNARSAVGETQLDWPFWLGKEKILLSFWSDLGGSFTPRIYSYVVLDKKTGDFRETKEAMIMGKIGNVILISGTLGPWFGEWIGQPKIEMAGLEIDSGQQLWANNYREGWVMEKYYHYDSPPRLLTIYAPDQRSFMQIPGRLIAIDPQTGKYLWAWDNLQTKAGKGDNQLVGQVQGIVLIADKNRGITYCVKASDGNFFWENDDLLLDQAVGISQNTLVAMRKGPDILYGLNPKNGRRLWYWELNKLTAPPVIHQDKIVYGSGPYLLVLDPETGKNARNAPITLTQGEATRLVPHQDLLLVQTGKPSGRGTLSAVKI